MEKSEITSQGERSAPSPSAESPRRKRAVRVVARTLLALAVIVPLSTRWPGGVSYARFAFTVVGACPIPALDFTIDAGGWISWRSKSHRITLAEVAPLLEGAPEVLVIANGWDGVARVDPEVLQVTGPSVEVLRTEAAFLRYNQLRAQGRRVALLAHTTC